MSIVSRHVRFPQKEHINNHHVTIRLCSGTCHPYVHTWFPWVAAPIKVFEERILSPMSGNPFFRLSVCCFPFRSCVIRIHPHASMLHITCGQRPSVCQSVFQNVLFQKKAAIPSSSCCMTFPPTHPLHRQGAATFSAIHRTRDWSDGEELKRMGVWENSRACCPTTTLLMCEDATGVSGGYSTTVSTMCSLVPSRIGRAAETLTESMPSCFRLNQNL